MGNFKSIAHEEDFDSEESDVLGMQKKEINYRLIELSVDIEHILVRNRYYSEPITHEDLEAIHKQVKELRKVSQ